MKICVEIPKLCVYFENQNIKFYVAEMWTFYFILVFACHEYYPEQLFFYPNIKKYLCGTHTQSRPTSTGYKSRRLASN